MTRIRLLILLMSFLTAACGGLNIKVDALDPSYVETINARQGLIAVLAEAVNPKQPTQTRLRDLRKEHRNIYERLTKEYMAEAATMTNSEDAQSLRTIAGSLLPDFDNQIAPEYEKVIDKLNDLDFRISRETGAKPDEKPAQIDLLGNVLTPLLVERSTTVEDFTAMVYDDLEGLRKRVQSQAAGSDAKARAAKKAVKVVEPQINTAQKATKLVPTGAGLVEDPLAYAVASAPDPYWAESFNETYGRGYLGDFNFAIKMENVANFTIKGLTFDPTEVAQIASKVTAQSLIFAAQIAGVPVSLPNLAADDVSGALEPAKSSQELADLEDTTARRLAELYSQQAVLRLIAGRIIAERGGIDSDNVAVRQASKEAIEATFEAHKNRLTMDLGGQ